MIFPISLIVFFLFQLILFHLYLIRNKITTFEFLTSVYYIFYFQLLFNIYNLPLCFKTQNRKSKVTITPENDGVVALS